MLVNLNGVLAPARKGKYVVRLFNTVNLELARGVMEAAEELDSPVIIGTVEALLPYGPLENLANLLIPMVERTLVPVVVHLDYGLREETRKLTLGLGSNSIIYNCSTVDYGGNMEYVKKMAEAAHSFGISIEAELDHVGDNGGGSAEGSDSGTGPSQFYTDPVQTRDFVDRAGTNVLAITVSMAHRTYKLPPRLDLDRISEIAETISTPLVLHNGLGLSDSNFRTAVEQGISKVNIFTDISQAGARTTGSGYRKGVGLTDMILSEMEIVKQSVIEGTRLFGLARQGSGR